jgi:hypothetical protein
MKKFIRIIILLLIFAGCKKYPDDSQGFHLRTAKDRLCLDGGWCHNSPDCNMTMIFKKDGTVLHQNFISTYSGLVNFNWEFINHKNGLRFTNPNDGKTFDYTILELDFPHGDGIMKLKNDTAVFYFFGPK